MAAGVYGVGLSLDEMYASIGTLVTGRPHASEMQRALNNVPEDYRSYAQAAAMAPLLPLGGVRSGNPLVNCENAAANSGAKLFPNLRPGDSLSAVPRFELVNQNGKWVTVGGNSQRTASGNYIFVVQDGKVFVSRPTYNPGTGGVAGHIDVARGQPVQYAGELSFSGRGNRGVLRDWSNASGHYQPTADAAGQAGLPLGLFNPVKVP